MIKLEIGNITGCWSHSTYFQIWSLIGMLVSGNMHIQGSKFSMLSVLQDQSSSWQLPCLVLFFKSVLWFQRKNLSFDRFLLVYIWTSERTKIQNICNFILISYHVSLTGHELDGALWFCILVIMVHMGGNNHTSFVSIHSSFRNDVSVSLFLAKQLCRVVSSFFPFSV